MVGRPATVSGLAVRLTLLHCLSLRKAAKQLGVLRMTVHRTQRHGLAKVRQRLRTGCAAQADTGGPEKNPRACQKATAAFDQDNIRQ